MADRGLLDVLDEVAAEAANAPRAPSRVSSKKSKSKTRGLLDVLPEVAAEAAAPPPARPNVPQPLARAQIPVEPLYVLDEMAALAESAASAVPAFLQAPPPSEVPSFLRGDRPKTTGTLGPYRPNTLRKIQDYLGTLAPVEAVGTNPLFDLLGIYPSPEPVDERQLFGRPETLITGEEASQSDLAAGARGVLRAAGRLTHPQALSTIAAASATGGLLSPAIPAIGKMISLGFSAAMANDLLHRAPELLEHAAQGDNQKFFETLGEMGFDATLLLTMASHAAGKELPVFPEYTRRGQAERVARPAQEAAQRMTGAGLDPRAAAAELPALTGEAAELMGRLPTRVPATERMAEQQYLRATGRERRPGGLVPSTAPEVMPEGAFSPFSAELGRFEREAGEIRRRRADTEPPPELPVTDRRRLPSELREPVPPKPREPRFAVTPRGQVLSAEVARGLEPETIEALERGPRALLSGERAHPAGEITGIDEATGLPIVRRAAANEAAALSQPFGEPREPIPSEPPPPPVSTARPEVAIEARERTAGEYGGESPVNTPSTRVPARYKLVEASELRPSHDAETFARNPAYPAGIQERAYHTSKEAQARVIDQEQRYDPSFTVNTNPDAVNGPPVVMSDGSVLGGNSRAMSTQRLYARGKGDVYRNYLRERAQQFGIPAESVERFRNPVLVREVPTPATIEEARRLASDLNKSMTGALGTSERAVSAGKSIRPETLRSISTMLDELGRGNEQPSLRDALRDRGRDIVQMLTEDRVITERERPQFIDPSTGGLSEEGKSFVERALLGTVVDDPVLMDRVPKSVLNKLDSSLGDIASFGSRSDEYNVLPLIRDALTEHAEITQRGVPVEVYLRQQAMFGPARNPAVDAVVRKLAERPKQVKEAFRSYSGDATVARPGQGFLLGMLAQRPSAASAFNAAFGTELNARDFASALLRSVEKATMEGFDVGPRPTLPQAVPPPEGVRGEPRRETPRGTAGGIGRTEAGGVKSTERPRAAVPAGSTLQDELTRPSKETLFVHINPLTPLGKAYTRYIGEPVWKAGSRLIQAAIGKIGLGPALITRYGQPSEYVELAQTAKKKTSAGAELGMELGEHMSKSLSQPEQQALGRFLKGNTTEADIRRTRTDARWFDAVEAAKLARQQLDTLGGQAVIQDLLGEETFFRNYGRYMPRMYRRWEVDYDRLLKRYGQRAPSELELSRFRKRQDIPEEVRLLMGEILEPAYPVAKGLAQLSHDVAYAEMFNRVAENPEWSLATQDAILEAGKSLRDYVQMPETKKLGRLSGKWVERHIADDINQIIRTRTEAQKIGDALISEWKYGKVVVNPATHVRNLMSNTMLAYLGGLSPLRVDIYGKALFDLTNKGRWYQEAKEQSNLLSGSTFTQAEMGQLLDGWNASRGPLMDRFASVGRSLRERKPSRALNLFRPSQTKLGRKASALYQAEEAWFKLAKYMANRESGMTPKAAAADAQKWLFDYSEVPKFVAWARRSPFGAPFITFTYKALPAIAESAVKYPWRLAAIIGVLYAVQEYSSQRLGLREHERKNLDDFVPPRMRGKALGAPKYMLLPWKDKYGQLQFLDLSYILPWGDIAETGATGVPNVLPVYGGPARALYEVAINKSAYTGREIYRKDDDANEVTKKTAAYLYRQAAPSLAPGGYGSSRIVKAAKGEGDIYGQKTSVPSALAGSVFGLKVTPARQSVTPARRLAREYAAEMATFSDTKRSKAERELMSEYRRENRDGKLDVKALAKDVKAGRLTLKDAEQVYKESKQHPLVRDFKRLSLDQALDVWDKMSPQERVLMRPELVKKANRLLKERLPSEQKKLAKRLRRALKPEQREAGNDGSSLPPFLRFGVGN